MPTWDGAGGAVGLELYELRAKGYVVGLEENKRAYAGPRLWANLRGSPQAFLNKHDPTAFAGENGVTALLQKLKERYPEGPLRALPRVYRRLFRGIRYQQGDDVCLLLAELEKAKVEVELRDTHTKVSTGIMGYLVLEPVSYTHLTLPTI